MLYLYDNAICEDLQNSFISINGNTPTVKVYDPEGIIDLVAQMKDDQVNYPIVAIQRDPDTGIDTDLVNFSRMHFGVSTAFDNRTNNFYNERAIPIKLSYKLSILTTNTADMDEMVRELVFKYSSMYFLTIKLPYEVERKIRFGVVVDYDSISKSSGAFEASSSGQLYQTELTLNCQGAVMVHYTPVRLTRTEYVVDVDEHQD